MKSMIGAVSSPFSAMCMFMPFTLRFLCFMEEKSVIFCVVCGICEGDVVVFEDLRVENDRHKFMNHRIIYHKCTIPLDI